MKIRFELIKKRLGASKLKYKLKERNLPENLNNWENRAKIETLLKS